jgi:hypothetical protein
MKNGRISLWKVKILPAVMANGTREIRILKIHGEDKMITVADMLVHLIVRADRILITMMEIRGQETVLTDQEETPLILETAL